MNRQLGKSGSYLFPIGLGCMGMSEFYGPTNENESIRTIHAAVERGVNFFDTADQYGSGSNEILLGRALQSMRDRVIISTKFGIVRDPSNPNARIICGRPDYVKKACDASLRRLNVDTIDLYYLHRLDINVPIEETVGAMSELVKQGKIKYIGLSEVNPKTLIRAHNVHPISALQTEYSLWSRNPENELLPLCEKLGISFVAYSPLGRGFLSGKIPSLESLSADDFRRGLPRFKEENLKCNNTLINKVHEISEGKNCTEAQIALSWILRKSKCIIPIPGTKRTQYMLENASAVNVSLSQEEMDILDTIFYKDSVMGNRYHDFGMTLVDL